MTTSNAAGQSTNDGTTSASVPAQKRWRPGAKQYGLQIYAHNANGRTAEANIDKILDYAVRRGANSVAYSFPIYTDGQRPTRVYTGPETPTPAALSTMVAAAHARGLRVTVRPLVDEANLRNSEGGWRGTIRPPRLSAWFDSYEQTLRPFLKAATKARADEFVLATELTSLQTQHEHWSRLAKSAGKLFPAMLSYTFNWDARDTQMAPPDGAVGLDLYFAVDLGPDATVEQLATALTRQIMAKPKALRQVMVAQEVGIAAQDGAYREPWNWGNPKLHGLNPAIQVNWFTAACRAVDRSGLDGIYFWMLDSSVDPTQVDAKTEGTAGFIGRPGEKAIERCFAGKP
ncbi:glycoside hydrolase family 113 [Monashia sp. NPDC004114]